MTEEVFRSKAVRKVLSLYEPIWALEYSMSMLYWDLNTYMPPGAAEERGVARAKLVALKQKLLLSPEFREAFRVAEKEEGLNVYERGVLRVLKREIEKYERIPRELLEEEARVTTEARKKWEEAKGKGDFRLFRDDLARVVDVERRKAECLLKEGMAGLYDALLDLYEEGLTARDVDRLFSELTGPLISLFRKVLDAGYFPSKHPLEEEAYDPEAMKYANLLVLEKLGYDFNRGRLDVSAHPFTTNMGLDDVRITTWYQGNDFRRSLGAAVHEFGHALYELQIDRRLARTPVGEGVSLGVHESQSRFWENIVWRTRAFAEHFTPLLRPFLPFLRRYSTNDVYRYFCIVRPEYIRVEADEIHYPLHVVLRYEIERGLIEGSVSVDEVPQLWNEKMEKYIGLTPPNDRLGCLQDVHWSAGYIGYFPTYVIGSVLAAQIARSLEKELGSIEELVREGRFAPIREWLREKVHRWGSALPPKELVREATGEDLTARYFLEYIEAKYARCC